jgi:hypothetical protein
MVAVVVAVTIVVEGTPGLRFSGAMSSTLEGKKEQKRIALLRRRCG